VRRGVCGASWAQLTAGSLIISCLAPIGTAGRVGSHRQCSVLSQAAEHAYESIVPLKDIRAFDSYNRLETESVPSEVSSRHAHKNL
jgi:hypothetical protein